MSIAAGASLSLGIRRPPEDARSFLRGDANASRDADIADAISALDHLFAGAGPLEEPFGACGLDPTDEDGLDCGSFSPCDL